MKLLYLTLLAFADASIAREAALPADPPAGLAPPKEEPQGYFAGFVSAIRKTQSLFSENADALLKVKECRSMLSWAFTGVKEQGTQMTNIFNVLGEWSNPFKWVTVSENVMDISKDVVDLEELDMRPRPEHAACSTCEVLDGGALMANLNDLPPPLVAEIWLRRTQEAGVTHRALVDWLQSLLSDRLVRAARPGFGAFVAELRKHVREAEDLTVSDDSPSVAPTKPAAEDTLAPVTPVFQRPDGSGNLAVSSTTSMWRDPYWRGKLLEAMWPHADHIGGYMIRTAVGKVGAKPGEEVVTGQKLAVNEKLMAQNSAFNAYSDKPVVAWGELDGELMQKLWSEAVPLFRELGMGVNDEYIVAFTLRGMKAGGLLDKSGKGLPGPIWHKDVFADYVVINYPFCFLYGYNNEVADLDNYEKKDPGSKHLAKFTEDVDNTAMVQTVPEGASEGFGSMIGFNNAETRHRAKPPMDATREEVESARRNAKDWGVPDNAVRAMIHMTIRRKSWTDVAEQLAYRIPGIIGDWLGPLVKCIQQVPLIEQYWFNEYGGFIDRSNRTFALK